MEFASFLKLLSQTDGFGCGFSVFGCFSHIFSLIFLCFLLVLGLMFLHFKGPSLFAQYLEKIYRFYLKTECSNSFDREHNECNNDGFVSKSQKKPIILHWSSDSVNRLSYENCDLLLLLLPDVLDRSKNRDTTAAALSETELEEEGEEEEETSQSRSDDDDGDEDHVFDVITLRKMVKRERKRGDCMKIELEKERLAAESAAEEAMAMLLKLRMEKSSVAMEAKQYKRVAEQKQIYDQQVIQSLQWMLMKLDDEDKIEINGD